MAKPTQNMYFAIKLIAPRLGDKRMLANSTVTTGSMAITTHLFEEAAAVKGAGARSIRIGQAASSAISGVAGHFTACVLDFSDAEDRKCKTLGEAEQLVKKNHKAWLADAYDWFVIPATILGGGATPGKTAKAGKTSSK